MVPAAFLRFDRPELVDARIVLRAVPAKLRESRRFGLTSPLGYLYEQVSELEPEVDEELQAGHYDEANLIWSFSGDVTGIAGITEPLQSAGPRRAPNEREVQ